MRLCRKIKGFMREEHATSLEYAKLAKKRKLSRYSFRLKQAAKEEAKHGKLFKKISRSICR